MKRKDWKWIWIALAVVVVFVAIRLAVAYFAGTTDEWTWWGTMWSHNWMMPFGMIGTGLFWLVVVFFAVRAFADGGKPARDVAAERLRERLANGEITIEEYDKLMTKIEGER
jgi:putative membrane protein